MVMIIKTKIRPHQLVLNENMHLEGALGDLWAYQINFRSGFSIQVENH